MADEARPEVKVDAKAKTTVQVDHVDRQTPPPFGTGSVNADAFKSGQLKGLGTWVVALAIKQSLDDALADIRAAGGIATSSGGIRDLGATVTRARSSTSFHYTGRAIDLYIYSGMVDPTTDPYLVTGDPDIGTWRIFARTSDPNVAEATFTALKKKNVKPPEGATFKEAVKLEEVEVTGRFFDLTAVFEKHGFKRIPAREDFMKNEKARDYSSAEWWHFQQENGLVVGTTTFGSLLLNIHTEAELKDTAPGNARNKIWNGKIFA
jgi:hypothetical protein